MPFISCLNSTPAGLRPQKRPDDRYAGFTAPDAGARLALDPCGACSGKGPVHDADGCCSTFGDAEASHTMKIKLTGGQFPQGSRGIAVPKELGAIPDPTADL